MANTGFDNSPGFAENLVNNAASNVAGIFSLKPNAKFLSGARVTLKINGKLVGFAFGISWTINTQVTEIMTVDDYLPYELAPQRVTVEGTISALHIPGVSATTEGWQQDVLSFLFGPYISIQAIDSATQQTIFATDKAMITSRTEDIRIDSLSNISLRWRAIGWVDEKTPTIPPANNYNKTSQDAKAASAATSNSTPASVNIPQTLNPQDLPASISSAVSGSSA